MWRIRNIDEFDKAVIIAGIVLFIAIAAVVVHGDQIGIRLKNFGPVKPAVSRTAIQISFDDPIDPSSVEGRFTLDPPAVGKFYINGSEITFQPAVGLKESQQYTVSVHAGILTTTGRTLKQTFQWSFTVRPSRLIYLGPADGVVQNLYMLDLTALSTPRQLTDSPDGVVDYDISPDGSKIVYTQSEGAGESNLYLWNASTWASTLLVECPDSACSNPVWRPDGGAVAFERIDFSTTSGLPASAPRVWIYDMTLAVAQRLFKDTQQLGVLPHWSPDGGRLAVFDVTYGGIMVHDMKTNTDVSVPGPSGDVGAYAFSPDGRWLYFPKKVAAPGIGYLQHFVVVDLAAEPIAQFDVVPDSDQDNDFEAVWQADSKALIVVRRPPGKTDQRGPFLYYVDVSTGGVTPLLVEQGFGQTDLNLSPDGETLAFERLALNKSGAHPELWVLNLKTNALKLVAFNAMSPRWLQ